MTAAKPAFSAEDYVIPRTLTPEQRQTVRSRIGKVSAECMAEAVWPLLNTLDAVEKELSDLKAKMMTREELVGLLESFEIKENGQRVIAGAWTEEIADALIKAGVQVRE